jgi:single-strand DNA-binding protein
MASDNQVTVIGNLTDDPELRYTPNVAAVCKFRIAVNRRVPDGNGQWKDGEASFFSVNCWRSLAENVAETLTRGPRGVAGRLRYRAWRARTEKRSAVEIEADEIARASVGYAKIRRNPRSSAQHRRRLGRLRWHRWRR